MPYTEQVNGRNPMIADFSNCFQRNPNLLQDVCSHRVEIANLVLNLVSTNDEDRKYYESEIRHYKLYDV
jgi:hypothetical protein